MKQVIQNFKSGALFVQEVPPPSIAAGMVLVEMGIPFTHVLAICRK